MGTTDSGTAGAAPICWAFDLALLLRCQRVRLAGARHARSLDLDPQPGAVLVQQLRLAS